MTLFTRTFLRLGLASAPVLSISIWIMHCLFVRDGSSFASNMEAMIVITTLSMLPLLFIAMVVGIKALHFRLRKPDFVITISELPTPMELKFLEQDRRLEKRERLKGEVFRNEGEIETFVANLTPDERKAWNNRPGPYR